MVDGVRSRRNRPLWRDGIGDVPLTDGPVVDVAIVGFDAIDDALTTIQAGDMAGTVAQQPALLGELGIETAAAVINGEDVEAEQGVEVQLVAGVAF